jgi:hypothetical protein
LPDTSEVDRLYPPETLDAIIGKIDCPHPVRRRFALRGVHAAAYHYLTRMNVPEARPATEAEAKKQLRHLAAKAQALADGFDSLSPEAKDLLRLDSAACPILALHVSAQKASEILRHAGRAKKGKGEDFATECARQFVADLARVFKSATGTQPRAADKRGGFPQFIRAAAVPLKIVVSKAMIQYAVNHCPS